MSNEALGSKKLTIICSAWSSGSTAVTGFLDYCGAYSCPPHIHTNDRRTPNSFESKFFRDLVAAHTDEFSLKKIGGLENFRSKFPIWISQQFELADKENQSNLVLKHPLASFLLEEIDRIVPNTKHVVVTRKFNEIEASRLRRGWNANYGSEGASKIYNQLYTFLHENEKQFHVVPYTLFLKSHSIRDALIDFVELTPDKKERASAENFIKR